MPKVGQVNVTIGTEEKLLELLSGFETWQRNVWIVTLNVDVARNLGSSQHEGLLKKIKNEAQVTADGVPVLLLCKIDGVTEYQKLSGSDLIWRIPEFIEGTKRPLVLAGGKPGEAELAAINIQAKFNKVHTVPFELEFSDMPRNEELERFLLENPGSIVMVGLGSPKQEYFIANLLDKYRGISFIGCGAAIGYAAKTLPRAPLWMQNSGLEWAYRLRTEPSRLFKRYILQDLPFLILRAAPPILLGRITKELSKVLRKSN